LTSKLWNNKRAPEDVEKALDESLAKFGTSYLDLYLVILPLPKHSLTQSVLPPKKELINMKPQIHWPIVFKSGDSQFPRDDAGKIIKGDTPISETWAAMEKLLETGKVKSIGISNFNERRIEELLKTAKVVPAVNQIEAHPFLAQKDLKAYHDKKGIHITAYSPLGNNIYGKPRILDDESVKAVADGLGVEVAQVLIAWAVKRGTSVVPKSVTKERIEKNFQRMCYGSRMGSGWMGLRE
jgi:diketogulonate reductase-like aldo/keto reductase